MNSSSSQKIHSPTFNEIMSAVNQVREICDQYETIPKSEIYNETWMLRLTLALLKEIDTDHTREDADHISEVCRAVRSGWISEGGLKPVFKREHTTWTDAILGRVYCDENDRNVKIKGSGLLEGDEYEGVIVVEAKMASELSRRVKNSRDYDQAARNIACLSRLIVASKVDDVPPEHVHFYVFAPESKIKEWTKKKCDPEKMIKDAVETIKHQHKTVGHQPKVLTEHCDSRELYFSSDEEKDGITKDRITIDTIATKARVIAEKNSKVISWESIIMDMVMSMYNARLLQGQILEKILYLAKYYRDACEVHKIECGLPINLPMICDWSSSNR